MEELWNHAPFSSGNSWLPEEDLPLFLAEKTPVIYFSSHQLKIADVHPWDRLFSKGAESNFQPSIQPSADGKPKFLCVGKSRFPCKVLARDRKTHRAISLQIEYGAARVILLPHLNISQTKALQYLIEYAAQNAKTLSKQEVASQAVLTFDQGDAVFFGQRLKLAGKPLRILKYFAKRPGCYLYSNKVAQRILGLRSPEAFRQHVNRINNEFRRVANEMPVKDRREAKKIARHLLISKGDRSKRYKLNLLQTQIDSDNST